MHRILPFLIILTFVVGSLKAQSNKTGTWGITTVVLPSSIEHRWGGYFEAQARTDQTAFNKFFYNEVKTGLSYALDNNYVALLGTGRYTTFDYKDLSKGATTTENRFWEQLTFTQYLDRIKFEHRYRAEQRWVNDNYRNRFRYRLNTIVPINNRKVQPKTIFVSVFDEIFLNNEQPIFERNRISATLGYQFTPQFTLQAGWINQFNNTLTNTNDKNNMLLNAIYQIKRKKPSSHEELPTMKD